MKEVANLLETFDVHWRLIVDRNFQSRIHGIRNWLLGRKIRIKIV